MPDRLSDATLARDYLAASTASVSGEPIHPSQKENAVSWIRLCALRETRDPTAWLDTPWRKEIMDAAIKVVDDAD